MNARGASRAEHVDRRPVAVVDIGSNSIRLVVFDGTSRVPLPLFNEKVLSGLGRGLERTGKLDDEGMQSALSNLRRFAELTRAMGVRKTFALATAAARDASNGSAFVREVRRATGLPVVVLSGKEEARLSALGVIAGTPDARGAMGDLGGGSLELVALSGGTADRYATLPLGPLRLREIAERSRGQIRSMIDDQLDGLKFLRKAKGRDFFAVGGAWRALAKLHMAQSNYGLEVIHHYAIRRERAIEFLDLVATQSRASLEGFSGVSRKRLETLPLAALVLERTLRRIKPERVVFSAYGLREGCLYDSLPKRLKRVDPLLSGARAMLVGNRRYKVDPDTLADWIAPIFRDKSRARLRLVTCYLADIAWGEHPDHRGDIAYRRALYMPLAGIDHPGRAYVALALYARYEGQPDPASTREAWHLLDEDALREAYQLGLALRVAYRLTGGAAAVFAKCRLRLGAKEIVLEVPGRMAGMIGEVVGRRLDALAQALDRKPGIRLR
ncbi:MAG: Ppx/GppA family phosphatase [Rhodospirillales bacterium]|nr:Ppx/GppA family phosphatase [Rhodospirillales bacterium]